MRELIVFAKEPEAGKVKTRLTPPLEPEEAVRLYQAFVRDVLALGEGYDRRRVLAPGGGGAFLEEVSNGYTLGEQRGADLGERMRNAFAEAVDRGVTAAVLVGTDAPTLPAELVAQAFGMLEQGADAVFVPATDGGYALVGLSRDVDVFTGVDWSTSQVMTQTLERAAAEGIRVALLPFWYDVDTVEDLQWLAAHLALLHSTSETELAPHTWGALEALAGARKGFLPCVERTSTLDE